MQGAWKRAAAGVGLVVLVLSAAGMTVQHAFPHVPRPDRSAFGLRPRSSAGGRYIATLELTEPVRIRQLTSLRIIIQDSAGRPVRGATVTMGGGMPEHGHGLPTRPRVAATPTDGVHVVDGVKFSMRGWWQFVFRIEAAAGRDSVTFNLDIQPPR